MADSVQESEIPKDRLLELKKYSDACERWKQFRNRMWTFWVVGIAAEIIGGMIMSNDVIAFSGLALCMVSLLINIFYVNPKFRESVNEFGRAMEKTTGRPYTDI